MELMEVRAVFGHLILSKILNIQVSVFGGFNLGFNYIKPKHFAILYCFQFFFTIF